MAVTLPNSELLPDISGIMDGAKARANALLQSSWMTMSGMGQPQVPPQAQMFQQPQNRPLSGADLAQWENSPTGQMIQGRTVAPVRDDYTALGLADNVPRSLIGTESGGNWGASNNVAGAGGNGHFGFLQFSRARLNEAIAAGAVPQGTTPEMFMKDRGAQVSAANWHFNDIDSRIRKAGYDQLIGQTIGGAPISWNGMRAMAHLGGFGGLSKYISTAGGRNPADAFGTSLRDYAIKHKG